MIGTDPIADRLESLALNTLEELVERHLPAWRIPGTFAGHPVEPDVTADLAFTLAHLHDLGVTEVAGTPTTEAIATVLGSIDGSRTHTFFSYRVAETLGRFGRFEGNELIAGWPRDARANLVTAVDSTDWIELLDSGLPRNYAAVLARCELARRDLGLPADTAVLDDLLDRTREMLGRNPLGFLDDSTHGVGRTDIYTVDVWHFTEPLAPMLGELWCEGASTAAALVERVGSPDGAAVTWGRSTGALAVALTIEMAALVLADPRLLDRDDQPEESGQSEFSDRRGTWLARAEAATTSMTGWFAGGLTSAHQHRSPYGYRGPFRRLQMTLDLLGKLAWSAGRLRTASADRTVSQDTAASHAATGVSAAEMHPVEAHPERDELLRLDPHRATSVWTFQGAGLGFVVPFVGATCSDYLAAPRRPGLFEVPVDSQIPCWIPGIAARHRSWAPAGVPETVEHRDGGVTARWVGLEALGDLDPPADAPRLPGEATVDYRVRGRTLSLEIALSLEDAPDAVGVVVPEMTDRPLRVQLTASSTDGGSDTAHIDMIDTAGISEWRSFTSELPVVHQIDMEVGREMSLGVSVTPALRVASTCHRHHYDRSLYGPLERDRRAISLPNPLGPLADAAADLDEVDLYHLHWPEWVAFDDLDEHWRIVDALEHRRIPIVWTAHNLTPHEKRPEFYDAIYQLWAERADAVIHHSGWGEQRMRERYRFPETVRHVVIPHGHFGGLYRTADTPKNEAEAALGLGSAAIRIGIVGAPRAERDVTGLLEAVTRSNNHTIEVCCWSLGDDEARPDATKPDKARFDDPRIAVAEPYRMVDADTYGLRLAACDVIALPFDPAGDMLATGVASDVVGYAKAALVSEWPYAVETLGDAGIPMGHTVASMTAALDALTPEVAAQAAVAARALQPEQSWARAAALTAVLFESVVDGRSARRSQA